MFTSSTYWKIAKLTKSGRPELIHDGDIQENDILIQNNVGIYQDNYKLVKFQKGKIYLTNRRIVFVDNDHGSLRNMELYLIDIDSISVYNGFLKSSPKIILKMRKKKITSKSGPIAASTNQVSEVNWICPICSFSNPVKTDVQVRSENDTPPCKSCGVKLPRYLIEGVIQASTRELTPANNIVSNEGFHCPTCTFLNDVSLKNCEMCGTRLVSSNIPPQLLGSSEPKELLLELEGEASNADSSRKLDIDDSIIKLSFRKGGVKTFLDKLELAREQAIWDHMKQNFKVNQNSVESSTLNTQELEKLGPKFGIQGLQNKREHDSYQKSLLLNNSLQDLENLMEKAKDLILLSKSYQTILNKDDSNKSKINDTANILANSKNSITILNNIITKNEFVNNSTDSSLLSSLRNKNKDSDLYIEELSRQLYEFLVDSDIITKNHGLITLFDLFIVYNRARGINLISPEELFKGVGLFQKLNFKYVLEEVPLISRNISDIISTKKLDTTTKDKFYIVSNKNFSFDSILQKIVRFIDQKQSVKNIYYGLSILEIQNNPHLKLNVNFLILNHLLLESCMDGNLCVDQELQGCFFYKNEFKSFSWDDYINNNDRQIEILEKEIDFDMNKWVTQNLPDQLNEDDYDDDDDDDDDDDEYATKEMNSRVLSPPNMDDYSLNYRLGGKTLMNDTSSDVNEVSYNNTTTVNGALKDLEGLHF